MMLSRNARIGLVLFTVYLLLYGGFVLLNVLAPSAMESTPWEGLNLAILYGFGLIIAAFGLAMLYGFLCRKAEPPRPGHDEIDASHTPDRRDVA